MKNKGFIFDLDGVIVDTAKYHFLAWKKLANGIGVDFTEMQNEQLKGVSRVRSLEKILAWGDVTLSDDEFNVLSTLVHCMTGSMLILFIRLPQIYPNTVL